MDNEPKLPHKLKWGDKAAAKVAEVEYLISVQIVGYTVIKGVIVVEVHSSVADEVGAWELPDGWGVTEISSDVFMVRPKKGAYYKYIKIKDIVHEES